MIEYKVEVFGNGDTFWYLNGKRHREDGPAIRYPCGTKYWFLNGKEVTEEDVMGKFMVVDGVKYKLTKV